MNCSSLRSNVTWRGCRSGILSREGLKRESSVGIWPVRQCAACDILSRGNHFPLCIGETSISRNEGAFPEKKVTFKKEGKKKNKKKTPTYFGIQPVLSLNSTFYAWIIPSARKIGKSDCAVWEERGNFPLTPGSVFLPVLEIQIYTHRIHSRWLNLQRKYDRENKQVQIFREWMAHTCEGERQLEHTLKRSHMAAMVKFGNVFRSGVLGNLQPKCTENPLPASIICKLIS